MLDLSIVIVSFNTKELTLRCLESIYKNTEGINFEVIIIDNASNDGSADAIKTLRIKGLKIKKNIEVLENSRNLGFAAANNQGWRKAKGRLILFLNSDTEIVDGTLSEMVSWMDKNKDVGVATCLLKSKNGDLQPTGGYFPEILSVFSWMTIQDLPFVDNLIKPFHPFHARSIFGNGAGFYRSKKELDWVTGAFLLTRREILEEIGGWDETYFMYVEEVDLCYRIKLLGLKVWFLPRWNIIHLGGGSSTPEFSLLSEYQGIKKFYRKFYPAWQYPFLKFLLRLGAAGRILLFGLLEGRKGAQVYVKAFSEV